MRPISRATLTAALAVLAAGCTSESDDAGPATTVAAGAAGDATPAAPAPASADVELDLGELAVQTTPTGVAASAEDAERCGSSRWELSGPVEYEQASPVPENCFSGAHAFDTSWYGLALPPGDYVLSLTIRRGAALGTTSAEFTITGA